MDVLARRTPYQWQGVHYQDHDDEPFLLLHNSGGGFVEGDVAELHILGDPGTRALVTTTAATKFYKCEEGGTARDLVEVVVGDDALFEYLPDEVIPFARSRVVRSVRFQAAETSRLFLSDVLSAGRISYGRGEAFAFSSIRSEFELRIGGRLVLLDRLLAKSDTEVAALESLWAGYTHSGLVVAYAPELPLGVESRIEEEVEALEGVKLGATRRGHLVCVRLLAEQAWQAHEAVYHVWRLARPALAAKEARPIRKS